MVFSPCTEGWGDWRGCPPPRPRHAGGTWWPQGFFCHPWWRCGGLLRTTALAILACFPFLFLFFFGWGAKSSWKIALFQLSFGTLWDLLWCEALPTIGRNRVWLLLEQFLNAWLKGRGWSNAYGCQKHFQDRDCMFFPHVIFFFFPHLCECMYHMHFHCSIKINTWILQSEMNI